MGESNCLLSIVNYFADFFIKFERILKSSNFFILVILLYFKSDAGVTYLVFSTLFISFQGVFAKKISHVSSFQIVFTRSILMFLMNYGLHKIKNINAYHDDFEVQFALILRGVFGSIALCLLLYCSQVCLISETYSIVYLAPIWTAVLAKFVLNEPFTYIELMSTIFGCIGMFLVLKPPFISFIFGESIKSTSPTYGRFLSLINSLMLSLVYISIRKVKSKAHAFTFSQYLNIFGMLVAPAAMCQWKTENVIVLGFYEFSIIFAAAFFAQLGQLAFSRGVQLEYAAKASVINFLSIPFGYIYEILIFGNTKQIQSIDLVGAFFIFLAAGLIFYKNWYQIEKRKKSLELPSIPKEQDPIVNQ